MRYRSVLGSMLLVAVVLGLVPSVSLAITTPTSTSIEGISIGDLHDGEIDELEEIEEALEQLGIDPPSETTIVIGSDGDSHVVFSDEPIRAGKATVEGESVPGLDFVDSEVVIATDVEVETEGDPVPFDELRNNPGQYEYELVQVDVAMTVASIAAKPTAATTRQDAVVNFDDPGDSSSSTFENDRPGELANWAVANLSENDLGGQNEFDERLPDSGERAFAVDEQFWGGGDSTVDVAVIPEYGGLIGEELDVGEYNLLVTNVEYGSVSIDSPDEIRSGDHDGDLVTVESDIMGSSISAQEYLTSISSCGGQTVAVPLSPPVCVPVTHDLVLHSGVLLDGTNLGDIPVVYAGVSNQIQTVPTEAEEGRYEITGEVVSTSEMGLEFGTGYALQVYDMERVGDLQTAESVRADVEDEFETLEHEFQSQIEFEQSDWSNRSTAEGESGERAEQPDSESTRPSINSTELETNTVEAGSTFEVTVDIWNPTNETTQKELTLYADNTSIGTKIADVPIVRGPSTIETSIDEPGIYELKVNSEYVGEIEVEGSTNNTSTTDGGGAVANNDGSSESGLGTMVDSRTADSVGALLAVIAIAVFLVGSLIGGARVIKIQLSDRDPNLSFEETITIICVSLIGFITSGILLGDDIGVLLLLSGVVGVISVGIIYSMKFVYQII